MTVAVDVARGALIEGGFPDLARTVTENLAGWPRTEEPHYDPPEQPIYARAFWLGHVAGGHGLATLVAEDDGTLSIVCPTCAELHAQ